MGMNDTAAGRAYVRSVFFWMMIYVGLVVALSSARNAGLLNSPWSWAAAFTPSIPIAGVMWAVLVFMRDSDEYVRALTTRRLVMAMAITQVICSAWGFMEVYAGAFHVELYMVVPIFWASYGAISSFVRSSS